MRAALASVLLCLGGVSAANATEVSVSFRDAGLGGFGGSQLQNIDSPDSILDLPGISKVEFVQDTASGRFEAIQVGCDSQGNDVAVTLRLTADPTLINGVDGGGYLSFLACVNWLDQPGGKIEGFGFMQPIGGSFTIDYIDPGTPDVQITRPAKTSGNNLFVDLTVSGGSVTYVFDGTPAASFIGSANFKPQALVDALNSYLQEVNPPSDPAIEGVKTSVISTDTGAAGLSAGDTITYSFAITNTGNVTLGNVQVASDTLRRADSTEVAGAITSFTLGAGQSTTLAPGESTGYSATYTVTQADIDAGGLRNTATVQGSYDGSDVTDVTDDGDDSDGNTADDPTEDLVSASASIEGVKTSVISTDTGAAGLSAGDTITYSFAITNTGNVTLGNVQVASDTLRRADGTEVSGAITSFTLGAGQSTTLAPGESTGYSATYTVTQADIDAGGLRNTATVQGSYDGSDVTDVTDDGDDSDGNTADDPTEDLVSAAASIEGVKTSVISNDTGATGLSAGDTLTYSFAITNTGNVTLGNVQVGSDTLRRADGTEVSGAITSFTLGAGQSTTLAPGESTGYSASYTVTQADIDAGGLRNTATVQGSYDGSDVTDVTDDGDDSDGNTADDPTEDLVVRDPLIRVTKTVDDSALDDGVRAGDTLIYTITIENIGNVSLTDVTLTDTFRDLTGASLTLTSGPTKTSDTGANARDTSMDVGDVWTYRASYDLTAAAIAAGGVENIASVTAVAPDSSTVTAESAVGGNTSDDGAGAPTDTGFPGEVSGTVRQYARGVPNVVVYLLRETAPGSGVYEYVTDPDNPSQRLSTVTDGAGDYVFVGVAPGTYGVEFDHPGSDADPTAISADYSEAGNRITGIRVDAGDVEVEQDAFFVDPSGVVYDSNTFAPLSGALVTLYYQATSGAARIEVPNTWLNGALGDLNRVTTGANGMYSFFLNPATAQDGLYTLGVSRAGYKFASEAIAPQGGTYTPALGGGIEQITGAAVPATGMNTTYYLSFKMQFSANPALTSNGIVNNHIPLDEDLLPLVETDLLRILEDDLAETMTQQSRQMNRFAAGALKRLKSRDRNQCLAALTETLAEQQVKFDTAKATLKPESGPVLDRMAEILNSCEEASFEIAGHTDDRASDAYNLALSQARVDSVLAALGQRGVNTRRLVSKGYGESRPVADNATEEGRAANRRVEFLPIEQAYNADECVGTDTMTRSFNASATNSGVTANGTFDRETRNCHDDSWRITSGTVSYLDNRNGVAQGMFNLTVRKEKFVNPDRVTGHFFGIYGSKSDVTGLADGEILGFGLNAGIYGAQRFASGLFVDYYLGGAAGRHAFDLDFSRTAGVVNAEGHYKYFAAFGGAALSGQTKFGTLTVSPRAGVDLAWSPGGDVDVTLTRGAIEDTADLRISKMSGARLFGEARIEDLLPGASETLAFTPRVFCDRPIGGTVNECGYGAALELSHTNIEKGTSFTATLDGETSDNQDYIGLVLEFEKALREGKLTGNTTVSSQGEIAITAQYHLEF